MCALIRVVATASMAFIASAASATDYHVDHEAVGTGSGLTWANACTTLQAALTLADGGNGSDVIRVAEGEYKPSTVIFPSVPNVPQYWTFQLEPGVSILGGYAGVGEPDPDARDPDLYVTILSGDHNGDDGPNFTNRSDNSFVVVAGVDSAINGEVEMDGFTVMGGAGSGSGSGISIFSGASPWITDCRFIDNLNTGTIGSAAYVNLSTPTFRRWNL
jgi:hypothetical protein